MQDRFIYKIFQPDEWADLTNTGGFSGSADDQRDGFIHLSAAHQVQGTLDKHYVNVPEIVLARVDTSGMGAALVWEVSRGGEPFPHLYAALPLGSVLAHIALVHGADSRYQVPHDFLISMKNSQ